MRRCTAGAEVGGAAWAGRLLPVAEGCAGEVAAAARHKKPPLSPRGEAAGDDGGVLADAVSRRFPPW